MLQLGWIIFRKVLENRNPDNNNFSMERSHSNRKSKRYENEIQLPKRFVNVVWKLHWRRICKNIKCYTFKNAASYDFPVVRVSDIKYFFQIFTFSSSYLSLRVFRVGTWLTVDRALYIPKHSGGAKGCLCQRLLVLWTNEKKLWKLGTVSSISQTFWSSSRMYKNENYGCSNIESYEEIDDL